MDDQIDDLEKRVQNLEAALIGYVALTEELLPPSYLEGVNRMMQDFFEKNQKMGGCAFNGFV